MLSQSACLFPWFLIDHEMSACLDMSVWNFQLKCQLFFLYRVDSWGFDNEGQGEAYDQTQARTSNIHELPCYPHPPIGLGNRSVVATMPRFQPGMYPSTLGSRPMASCQKSRWSWHFFLRQQVDGKLCATNVQVPGEKNDKWWKLIETGESWQMCSKAFASRKIWFTLARIARSARLMRLFST